MYCTVKDCKEIKLRVVEVKARFVVATCDKHRNEVWQIMKEFRIKLNELESEYNNKLFNLKK